MFEVIREYFTIDWLKIGDHFKGVDDHQPAMFEVVDDITMEELEQETILPRKFNFVHIIVSGEPFKTLKVTLKEGQHQTFEGMRSEFFPVIDFVMCQKFEINETLSHIHIVSKVTEAIKDSRF